MNMTLGQVQSNIERFLQDAKECARHEYGFSALLTVFPIIEGVSEALLGAHRPTINTLFQTFVAEMDDKSSWITTRQTVHFSDDDLAGILTAIRNGLTHMFSLPTNVLLANNMLVAQVLCAQHPGAYLICTTEFVCAVEQTVCRIVKSNPNVAFDPEPPQSVSRGAADRHLLPVAGTVLPASGVSGTLYHGTKGDSYGIHS